MSACWIVTSESQTRVPKQLRFLHLREASVAGRYAEKLMPQLQPGTDEMTDMGGGDLHNTHEGSCYFCVRTLALDLYERVIFLNCPGACFAAVWCYICSNLKRILFGILRVFLRSRSIKHTQFFCTTSNTSCTAVINSSSIRFRFCVSITAHLASGDQTSQPRCESAIYESEFLLFGCCFFCFPPVCTCNTSTIVPLHSSLSCFFSDVASGGSERYLAGQEKCDMRENELEPPQ